eukprot:m.129320 g.129320  ORF g.129320 m.129320 type:complete len:63 (-) comp22321_c0_seq3:250-438(-)
MKGHEGSQLFDKYVSPSRNAMCLAKEFKFYIHIGQSRSRWFHVILITGFWSARSQRIATLTS